jgi:hypothetical protein
MKRAVAILSFALAILIPVAHFTSESLETRALQAGVIWVGGLLIAFSLRNVRKEMRIQRERIEQERRQMILDQLRACRCPICGYSLFGNVSGTCPECGTNARELLK